MNENAVLLIVVLAFTAGTIFGFVMGGLLAGLKRMPTVGPSDRRPGYVDLTAPPEDPDWTWPRRPKDAA